MDEKPKTTEEPKATETKKKLPKWAQEAVESMKKEGRKLEKERQDEILGMSVEEQAEEHAKGQ